MTVRDIERLSDKIYKIIEIFRLSEKIGKCRLTVGIEKKLDLVKSQVIAN